MCVNAFFGTHLFFDMNEDAELYKIWGEGEPQDALEFERAFKEKYGRKKKRTRRQ